ncbi:MAG: hypothetical protein H0V70_06080 [Ktedonobacteraceae bacterium]|nr:hypothetical protein [Ktedonobacteraceae bacterium]
MHQTLFGEKQGAVETLRHLIRERFLGQANSIHIPEAWFYWPITAGGAGLYQVHILTSGYNEYLAKQTPLTIPESQPPIGRIRVSYGDLSIVHCSTISMCVNRTPTRS